MGKYSEETRIINRSKDQCEARLLAFDVSKYDLKNHITDKEESLLVFHTKIVFSANGQRITVKLKNIDDHSTEVNVRSELTSNVLTNDRGVNKKNINTIYSYLNQEKTALRNSNQKAQEITNRPKRKRRCFAGVKTLLM